MEKFYCREEELRKLNARYENEDFECLIIYGRRRVGKSFVQISQRYFFLRSIQRGKKI